jgi:hypothetical protein
MTKRKAKLDEGEFTQLQNDALYWEKWDNLRKSSHGKFLIAWLDLAIEETLNDEDTKDIYTMDKQAREYFFASVRSKRQTLKAFKNNLLKAEEEKQWRAVELSKITDKE